MRRCRLPLTIVAVASLAAAGCSRTDRLAFRESHQIDIVAPSDRAEVTLPVQVRWTSRPPAAGYAVFVDRAPQPPGESVRWFARNDDACRATAGCPDATYLAERDVFTTSEPRFSVRQLLNTARDGRRREFHEVTVVVLDESGRRVGEHAWSVEFEVTREEPS